MIMILGSPIMMLQPVLLLKIYLTKFCFKANTILIETALCKLALIMLNIQICAFHIIYDRLIVIK